MEQWRQNILTEAAKSAEDLKNFKNLIKSDQWLRSLWGKYGMWKLADMFDITYPDTVRNNWGKYSKETRSDWTLSIWRRLTWHAKVPVPCVIVTPDDSDLMISYGAVIPRVERRAELLVFDSGDRSAEFGSTMGKIKPMKGLPGGSIRIHPSGEYYGECSGAYIVDSTYQTTQGWGPLLYDVTMELATILGDGLTPSRGLVSSHAKPIWDYYLKRRGDVEKDQLDIKDREAKSWGLKQLTPTIKSDDCTQKASYDWAHGEEYGAWEKGDSKSVWTKIRRMSDEERANVPWTKVSLSKKYKKEPDVIKFLGDNGMLHCPSLGYDVVKYHTKDAPEPPPEEPPEEPPPEDVEKTVSENVIRIKIK